MKELNVKNMKEALVNNAEDQESMDRIWYNFFDLANLGFIDINVWSEFMDQTKGWYFYEDDMMTCIRDREDGDGIVWEFAGEEEMYEAE